MGMVFGQEVVGQVSGQLGMAMVATFATILRYTLLPWCWRWWWWRCSWARTLVLLLILDDAGDVEDGGQVRDDAGDVDDGGQVRAIPTCRGLATWTPWPTQRCTSVSWVAPVASRMCSAKPLSFSPPSCPCTVSYNIPSPRWSFCVTAVALYGLRVVLYCDTVLCFHHLVYCVSAIPFTVKWIPDP